MTSLGGRLGRALVDLRALRARWHGKARENRYKGKAPASTHLLDLSGSESVSTSTAETSVDDEDEEGIHDVGLKQQRH